MTDPIHSTGRGGAGNIGPDPNTYVDGSIVREGAYGESKNAEYSAGRGGAGNMASPRQGPQVMSETDVVPETAFRSAEGHENFHTGRGGAGNEHREAFGGHSTKREADHKGGVGGLIDKAKHLIGADKKEPKETTS